MELNKIIEILKEEENVITNKEIFSSLKYFREKENIEELYKEIEKNFKLVEYENILLNLVNLYPLSNKLLKKILLEEKIEKKEKYYVELKNEIDKKLNEKDIELKIKEIKEKYSEELLSKKKIELQQEKEKNKKREREFEKLKNDIENLKKELITDISKYSIGNSNNIKIEEINDEDELFEEVAEEINDEDEPFEEVEEEINDENELFDYYELGNKYYNEKKYEMAKKNYIKAMKKNNVQAMIALGNLYIKEKEYDKAKKYYIDAIVLGSNEALINMGELYEKMGDYTKAREYFLKSGATKKLYELYKNKIWDK